MDKLLSLNEWQAEYLDPYWAITNENLEDIGYIRNEEGARLVIAAPKMLKALELLLNASDGATPKAKAEARRLAIDAVNVAKGRKS